MASHTIRLWVGRLLVGAVLLMNFQAALVFIWFPGQFAPGFGLEGPVGDGMMRGMGILFLMWTVPYWVAVSHPARHRLSLYEAIAMQAIGLLGESLLLSTFLRGAPHNLVNLAIQAALLRFIIFDGGGLLALITAAGITWRVSGHALPE